MSFGDEDELQITIHELPDMFQLQGETTEFWDLEFFENMNDPGSGSFVVENGSTEAGTAVVGTSVKVKHLGEVVYNILVEEQEIVEITDKDEVEEATKISGRGAGTLLEWSVIYPSNGLYSLPRESDRSFDWSSRQYDDSSWGYASVMADVGKGNAVWRYALAEYAEKEFTKMVWHSGGSAFWAGPGFIWLRKFFTVPAGVNQIVIDAAADDTLRVLIDGVEILKNESRPALNNDPVIVDVTPGEHLVAIEAQNLPALGGSPPGGPTTVTVQSGWTLWGIAEFYYKSGRMWRVIYDANQAQIQSDAEAAGLWNPSDPGHWIFPGQEFVIPGMVDGGELNPGGVACTGHVYNGTNRGDRLFQTDDTWRCTGYLDSPPGMSIGKAILVLLWERAIRGSQDNPDFVTVPEIVPMFTELVDSADQVWPSYPESVSPVGTDYLTFIKDLAQTYIDWWMSPNYELYVWIKGDRGQAREISLVAPPEDSTEPDVGNLMSLTRKIF